MGSNSFEAIFVLICWSGMRHFKKNEKHEIKSLQNRQILHRERVMGVEPTTFSLARRHSTGELHPQIHASFYQKIARLSLIKYFFPKRTIIIKY
jgi:hypothetical protein